MLLLALFGLVWYYDFPDTRRPIVIGGQKIHISDGDSFAVGNRKLRLDGIDAPEYAQTCYDVVGKLWECGKAAREALERLLRTPGLACGASARDQYARDIATCSADGIADIGAAQVRNGMAVSHEFYGIRDYGDEEDAARSEKRGIWRGSFVAPDEWRDAHSRNQMP